MKSFLAPLLTNVDARFRLTNARNGNVLAGQLLTAFDSKSRNKGLLGRDALPRDSALIIAPSNAVHTWFMRFPIDIAFVDRGGRVLKTRAAVPPWRIALSLRAFAVIELPAGALHDSGTMIGDSLSVTTDLRRE